VKTKPSAADVTPSRRRFFIPQLPADRLANSIAETTFTATLSQSEINSYASIFDYQNGTRVQHEIIEYLNERSENEVAWLETLGNSEIPTTTIWVEQDEIAPVRVPDFVWENYLADQETSAAYWRIPCAAHYLQVDTPDLIVKIMRTTLAEGAIPEEIEDTLCNTVKIH
jgi:pimeloyl-ACP methyl ester carboxylesterase